MALKLPVVNKGITLTEIPNHIAVFFEIGNCTIHCKGCHSPELWDTNYTEPNMSDSDILDYIVEQANLGANAILFMGGLDNYGYSKGLFLDLLEELDSYLPVCIYAGNDDDKLLAHKTIPTTWLKIGHYDHELGGLDSPKTNQKFYEWSPHKCDWVDKTKEYFQGGKHEENL